MKFSPETLMAYADGELDAETRRALEAEMAVDPQLAQEVEQHRALRTEVGGAFAGVLEEPVPDRLLRAANKTGAKTEQSRRQWSWPEWTSIAMVVGVFVIGQGLEGYVLSPKLVGAKVGLHPVWMMFSLLAFGYLLGFIGLLIAVPLAATIGVLARFALRKYTESPIYTGQGPR